MLECSAEENRTVLLERIKNPPNLYTYSYQQNKCISLYLSSLFSSLNPRRKPRPGLLLYHHNLCIPRAQSCRHGAAVDERRPVPSLVIRHSGLRWGAQLRRRGAPRAHGRQSTRPRRRIRISPDRPLVLLVEPLLDDDCDGGMPFPGLPRPTITVPGYSSTRASYSRPSSFAASVTPRTNSSTDWDESSGPPGRGKSW